MTRRRFFLIFNILVISLILVTGFVVYKNRDRIGWLKGLFGKAAVSQTYSVSESSPGNQYILGVGITCSATSDVNASGFIVGWNVTISGSNLDVGKVSTGVKIHVPWNTSIEGTNEVTGSQYYPGAQPPVVVASAETFAQPGYSGSLVQCSLPLPPPPVPDSCELLSLEELMGIAGNNGVHGSFDLNGVSRSVVSGGGIDYYITFTRSGDKTSLSVDFDNKTSKCFVGSLGVYKMYDGVLAHQKYFGGLDNITFGTGVTHVSTTLPTCMAQIDLYGGPTAPRQLTGTGPGSQYPLLGYVFNLNQTESYLNPVGPLCSDTSTDRSPVGNFDAISCDSIVGWALDQDELSRSLDVHVYRDGQAGSGGVFLGSYTTNVLRTDVNQAYGATGTHGFVIPTPESLRDGQPHQVFIYAINPVSGKNNPLIIGSPKSLTCPLPPPPVLVCNPGSQTVAVNAVAAFTVSGGVGGYAWSAPGSNTATATGATFTTSYSTSGNKTVTVTSGGQSATCAVIVNQLPPPPTPVACVPASQVADTNAQVNFAASGGTGTYSWFAPDSVKPSGSGAAFSTQYVTSGNKTVTVTSGGQSATCAVTVRAPVPELVCSPNSQTAITTQPVNFAAQGGSGVYSWSAPGSLTLSGGGSTFTTSYTTSGNKTVTVTSGGKQATCLVTVVSPPPPPAQSLDIEVHKTVQKACVTVGEDALFTVSVTNKGPLAANSLEINDFWSGLLAYKNATVSQGTWDVAQGRWTVGALAVGDTATLVMVMNVYGAGTWTNTASVFHSVPADVTQSNNTSTAQVCGVAGPPPPAQLTCTALTPNIDVNETAVFSASGGTTYAWTAAGGSPVTGTSATFATRYASPGTKTVTVTSGSRQASCSVVVTQVVPHNPVGNFDGLSCEGLEGWAYDPDVPATSIDVHVYDGQAGNGGVLLGAYPTTIDRPDVNQTFSITGAHGFRVAPLPQALLDGQIHKVYVYAIDRTGGVNTVLTSSPRTLQCGGNPQTLSCTPTTQTVAAGQPASFSAVGGSDPISWFADFGSSPSSGTGRTFSTSYASPGSKVITVTSGSQRATCALVVTTPPPTGVCKLEITKTVDKANAQPGDELNYTIALKNSGTAACGNLTGVKVQDQYDAAVSFVRESHSSNVVRGYGADGSPFHDLARRVLTWNANMLQPNQTATIQWTAVVKDMSACAVASVVNIAKATSEEYNHLQTFVTSTQVVTDVAASCPTQVVCAPATQQVAINKPASFSISGGSGTPSWLAVGGTPSSGSGPSFVTQYTQPGSKQVVVRVGGVESTCAVIVTDSSTPPSPVVCSPQTQTVSINQQAILVVSGASGSVTWSAPGATVTAGTGSTFSTAYATNGSKTVTVTASNGTASCTVSVTGTNPPVQVDLAVQKSVAPSLIQVGQTAVFTVSVTNNGPVDATGVQVTDSLPSGVSIVGQPVTTKGTFDGGTGTWNVGALSVSATAELRITVTGDSVGSKLNTAVLSASTPTDTNTANNQAAATLTVVAGSTVPELVCAPSFQTVRVNQQAVLVAVGGTGSYNWTAPEATPSTGVGASFSAYYTSVGSRTVTITSGSKQTTCTVNVAPEPVPTPLLDVAVTKQVSPALTQIGQTATFTITATNVSTVQGSNIQYKDTLPSGLTVGTVSASQGTYTSATGVWDIGTLAPNQSVTLSVQVTGPQAGTYVNQVALLSATPQDSNASNNSASATLVVQSPGGGNPSLICANDTNSAVVGQDIKFYANNATGMYAWSAPSGQPVSGSGSIFTTRFSQVGPQAVTVASGNQTATCKVTISAPTALVTTADLSLTKTASPAQILVGQETIFTIKLQNEGPGSPELVSVKDTMPAGLNIVRTAATQGSYDPVTGIWAVGRMGVGQEVVLLITVKADKVGTLTNTGEVWTSTLPDLDSTPGNSNPDEDDQASATVTVGGILPNSGSPTQPITILAILCIVAAAAAVQIRTVRVARLQTPLGTVEVTLDE